MQAMGSEVRNVEERGTVPFFLADSVKILGRSLGVSFGGVRRTRFLIPIFDLFGTRARGRSTAKAGCRAQVGVR